ncbi:hypothetical protein FH972_005882 [Carpinus fangiana]|uniref:Uncharacterized protein n=1 Tax=Carpinus fangiana TaxID=176857 RepID=A0A5N6QQK1_9ROSI|nr:hypothetical protein FH972_005882 [Carpinus fangiana]
MVSGARVTGEVFLEVREEDPGIHVGGGILLALQHQLEGTVGGVAGLLTVLQELVHRGGNIPVHQRIQRAAGESHQVQVMVVSMTKPDRFLSSAKPKTPVITVWRKTRFIEKAPPILSFVCLF